MDSIQAQYSNMKFLNYNEYRASCRCQYFSLPDSVIFYFAKNPNLRTVYLKTIKTCKYFFIKNPFLLIHCLIFDDENGWQTCIDRSCRAVKENQKYRKIELDLEKLQCKISIAHSLKIFSSSNSDAAGLLFSKLYSGKITNLVLVGQKIFFTTYLMIKQDRLRRCTLINCRIFYENGNEVSCADTIAPLTDLEMFDCRYQPNILYNFTKTSNELLQLSVFKNLTHFTLCGLNDTFDIDKFFEFLKNNQKMCIRLAYKGGVSFEYQIKLQAITDEVLDAETPRNYKPFYIQFHGQSRRKALYNLYKQHM